jgi:hypothetical protein
LNLSAMGPWAQNAHQNTLLGLHSLSSKKIEFSGFGYKEH